MGKFRPISSHYDPRQDSSPGAAEYYASRTAPEGSEAAAGWYADEAIILIQTDTANENVLCLCGCLQTPKGKDAKFCMGHDARLRGKLIRAHLLGLEVVRVRPGMNVSSSAMDYAKNLGDSFVVALEDAWTKEHDRIERTLAAANGQVLEKAVGPQVGTRVLIKVGRWAKTGQVAAIYDDGDSIEVEYVDAKGNVKTIRKPKTEVTVEA